MVIISLQIWSKRPYLSLKENYFETNVLGDSYFKFQYVAHLNSAPISWECVFPRSLKEKRKIKIESLNHKLQLISFMSKNFNLLL